MAKVAAPHTEFVVSSFDVKQSMYAVFVVKQAHGGGTYPAFASSSSISREATSSVVTPVLR
jgi:hypothetical protein